MEKEEKNIWNKRKIDKEPSFKAKEDLLKWDECSYNCKKNGKLKKHKIVNHKMCEFSFFYS